MTGVASMSQRKRVDRLRELDKITPVEGRDSAK